MTETTSPFDAAFDTLQGLGYHTLPIMPAAFAAHDARGKAPAEILGGTWRPMSKWQRYRDRKILAPEAEIYRHWPETNIGVVCGSIIGEYQLVAVDIDARDYAEVEEIVSALPHSPMAKRGQKGVTLFYRGERCLRSRSYKRSAKDTLVDLLTGQETKQTVMPPSIHPETGKPYEYLRGPVPAKELPILDLDAIAELEETLEGLGWNPHAVQEQRRGMHTTQDQDADGPFRELNLEALARLDDWVPELGLYDVQSKRGGRGYCAVATWRESSTGRPTHKRKRNLHITPQGIRDFGPDVGYTAIDLVMAATGRNFETAFEWLHIKLHGTLPVISEMLRAPEARIEPPCGGDGPEDDIFGSVVDMTALLANKKRAELDIDDSDDTLGELPVYPPHETDRTLKRWRESAPSFLVREIVDWLTRAEPKPMPALAILAALSTISTAIGRQYMTPLKGSTALYGLALAPSGSGKNKPLQAPGRMLSGAGLARMIGPARWTAGSVLERELKAMPVFLCISDEYGDALARMTAGNASPSEKSKLDVLKQLFSTNFDTYKTQSMALEKAFEVHAPHVGMFAAATPGKFFSAMTADAIESGFFNRFLTVIDEADIDERKRDQAKRAMLDIMVGADTEGASLAVPDEITTALRRLHLRRDRPAVGELQPSTRATTTAFDPMPEQVLCTPDAAEMWAAYQEWTRETVPEIQPDAVVFYARAAEIALRVATVLAISETADPELDGDGVAIDGHAMRWALRFTDWSVRSTMKEAGARMFASEQAALMERLLDYFAAKHGKWVERRKVVDRFKRQMRNRRELDDILQVLIDAGNIDMTQKAARDDGRGGRPTTLFRFVRRS